MSEAMGFVESLMGQMSGNMNSCMLCKIEEYDHKAMKAKVTPMVKVGYKDKEFEEQEMLIEVPVAHLKAGPFIIRPPYKEGDIVVVIFADRDIENTLLSGGVEEPNSARTHSIDDAIVISGLLPYITEYPDEHKDDLIIAKDDFSSKIVMKENGDIVVEGKNIFLGSEDADEGVPLGDSLKSWLDSHTHPTVGPPTSSSPSPSKVVKTI